jgi:hypothetical protein
MRYIIDAESKEAIQEIRRLEAEKKIVVRDAGSFDILSEKVEMVRRALQNLSDAGIPDEFIIAYVSDKTGIGKSSVSKVLSAVREFYDGLVRKSK